MLTSFSVAFVLLIGGGSPTERPARNVLRPILPFSITDGVHRVDSVIVKFIENEPIRSIDGALVALDSTVDLAPIRALLSETSVERLFTRSVEDLDQERAALIPRTPVGYPLPADLNQYYRITTSGVAQTERLVNELNQIPLVETAYAELSRAAIVPSGSDILPTTPLLEAGQTYKGPPPTGVGYDALRSIVGARAPDLTVGHLEISWNFGHEDACQLLASRVVGVVPDSSFSSAAPHGNAVAGILIADRNAYGVRGMSDGGNLILSSIASGSPNMISLCTAVSEAGDVWISSFAWGLDSGVLAPVDWPQAEFDAIFTAATKGIIYCFGAGNTNSDLGDTSLYGSRYAPGAPDSGGVIVGASKSSNLDKIDFSNYGSRVDCHAWGENIRTLGYGDLFSAGGTAQAYTNIFGGTSGAGPIVAGVAGGVSNIVREQNGVQLTPFQIRDLLRTTGTPQGAGGHIGPRPDLGDLLATQGLPDGLLVDDDAEVGQPVTVSMSGVPLSTGILFVSTGRGRAPVGLNRDFLLDPTVLFPLAGLPLNGAGEFNLVGVIPNNPAFANTTVYLQLATQPTSGSAHLSNSVELWIRG